VTPSRPTLILAALLGGCGEAPSYPEHHLAFGGDVSLGRKLNEALLDDDARPGIIAEIVPRLQAADLALVNAEGVIAGGGAFADKGEPRPHMYRAHPVAMELLAEAGVDILAIGNNHSGDYGPLALTEMLDRARVLGLDYAGGGHDLADARTPAYRVVGDTVVAIVGADLTIAAKYAATVVRPGSLYAPGLDAKRADEVVTLLLDVLADARRHAHVVVLSPHWGDNFQDHPSEATRALATRLLKGGYDAILGHSAHQLQGVELVDGKPVLYDAGNLLLDYERDEPSHESMLFDVTFTRAGVTGIHALPLRLHTNRTVLADPERALRIARGWADMSTALGTPPGDVGVHEGTVTVRCDPGAVDGPEGTPVPPSRPVPPEVRTALEDLLLDALPVSATPADVAWENGIHLVGYEILLRELPVPKAGNIVSLYFTTSQPLDRSYEVRLEARGATGGRDRADHLPGDWVLPTTAWPTGRIVHDRTLMRLTMAPEGEVQFLVGLVGDHLLTPTSGDASIVDAGLVDIGKATFVPGAPRLFDVLNGAARDPQ
jgi:poly-gamma-glutamate capsule biosynthesis protein CapA/YwtB (metallophosphatase superfamily)